MDIVCIELRFAREAAKGSARNALGFRPRQVSSLRPRGRFLRFLSEELFCLEEAAAKRLDT
jgi:hypothetical protein